MKVLHVELGRHLYGGARQVVYLLNGMTGDDEHHLVCADGAEIVGAITNPAVSVTPMRCRGDLDLAFLSRLRRLIRTEKPDLLHIHSRRGDLLATLAGRREGIPMIYSRRVDNPPRWLDRKLKFPLYRRIVTISEGIRGVLLKHGVPLDQIVCVPSAVDTDKFRPDGNRNAVLRELDIAGAGPVLAIVAQLIPRKGHGVLFDALPAVLSRYPDLQLLVFGRGPLESELRAAVAAAGLQRSVHFAGFRDDLNRILPCLDLLVHPAFMEGLGVSLLEAAACGLPIVAGKAGGIPEIVHHGFTGLLVQPGDRDGLADAILTLLDKPERRARFGEKARELVLQRFSIPKMVEGNRRVYSAVLDEATA